SLELQSGKIDAENLRSDALILPQLQLPAGRVEHPLPQNVDLSTSLGDRDKDGRRDIAAFMMPPAQQRFQSDDTAGSELDLRLIMELELAALDGAAQVVGEDHAFPHLPIEFGAVEPHAIAAVLLGAIEREVGL